MKVFNLNKTFLNGMDNNIAFKTLQDLQMFQIILLNLISNLNNNFYSDESNHLQGYGLLSNNLNINKNSKEQGLDEEINLLVNIFINWFLIEKNGSEFSKFKSLDGESKGIQNNWLKNINFISESEFLIWLKEKLNNIYQKDEILQNSEFLEELEKFMKNNCKDINLKILEKNTKIDTNPNGKNISNLKIDLQNFKKSLFDFIRKDEERKKVLEEIIKKNLNNDLALRKVLERMVKYSGDVNSKQIFDRKEDLKELLDNKTALKTVFDEVSDKRTDFKSEIKLLRSEFKKFNLNELNSFEDVSKKELKNFHDYKDNLVKNFHDYKDNLVKLEDSIKSKDEVSNLFRDLLRHKKIDHKTWFLSKNEIFLKFDNILLNQPIQSKLDDKVIRLDKVKLIEDSKISNEFLQSIKNITLETLPEGEKKASIKLEPPDLGSLDLEIKIKDKDVRIVIRADKVEVLNELRNNIHHIKNSLQELGLNLKDFQFYLGNSMDNGYFKNFEKREEKYFNKPLKEVEEVIEAELEPKQVFINRNGKIYYIV